jgi:hypothetical protein
MKRAVVYYTDSILEPDLDEAVRAQITKAANGIPIISVSQKPLDFGKNICVGEKPRCYRSLYEQLLLGVEEAEEGSIVYLCEHDVFYHPSYFEFVPPEREHVYFNYNRFYWSFGWGSFCMPAGRRALSQAVAYREVFIDNVTEHLILAGTGDAEPHMPGTGTNWFSKCPNIDIRHKRNFTGDQPTPPEGMEACLRKGYALYSVLGWGTADEFTKAVKYGEREEK